MRGSCQCSVDMSRRPPSTRNKRRSCTRTGRTNEVVSHTCEGEWLVTPNPLAFVRRWLDTLDPDPKARPVPFNFALHEDLKRGVPARFELR